MEETFKVICKIHRKLPHGGILVFLTGKKEINDMCERLKNEFENNKKTTNEEKKKEENNAQSECQTSTEPQNVNNEYEVESDNLSDNGIEENSNSENFVEEETDKKKSYSEAIILPLYSSLPQTEQNKVFEKDCGNKRLIVISTNVAETSLTIPNIKYVVDCGKEKKRV